MYSIVFYFRSGVDGVCDRGGDRAAGHLCHALPRPPLRLQEAETLL